MGSSEREYYDDGESDLQSLDERVEKLEASLLALRSKSGSGFNLAYVSGLSLAMILSWSRNPSVLLCIGHGFASWLYVIYFTATRAR